MSSCDISHGVSRGDFLRGALATMGLGAFCGRRMFAAPQGAALPGAQTPALVFGVVTDTHMRVARNKIGFWRKLESGIYYSDGAFRNALRYFRSQNVDAVMHCGDWCDRGCWREMEFHSTAWYDVFPNGTIDGSTTGKKVKKLFVLGNHDYFGETDTPEGYEAYDVYGEDYLEHLTRNNLGSWQELWGEDYEAHWHREVNGYHFFGFSWADDKGKDAAAAMIDEIEDFGNSGKLDGKPFFVMTHVDPCSSSGVGDSINETLSQYGNAIGFFGHEHFNLANWDLFHMCGRQGKVLWVKTGCMKHRNGKPPAMPRFAIGFGDGTAAECESNVKYQNVNYQHGYLVKVYSDKIVLRGVDFDYLLNQGNDFLTTSEVLEDHHCATIAPDWVIPLVDFAPDCDQCSMTALQSKIGTPQFAKTATLSVSWEDGAAILTIPDAVGNLSVASDGALTGTRSYGYHVEVVGEGGEAFRTSVYADSAFSGFGQGPNSGVTKLKIRRADLPHGSTYTIRVWPCSALGTVGNALEQKNVARGARVSKGAIMRLW